MGICDSKEEKEENKKKKGDVQNFQCQHSHYSNSISQKSDTITRNPIKSLDPQTIFPYYTAERTLSQISCRTINDESLEQVGYNCFLCGMEIYRNIVQLNCLHTFHLSCIQNDIFSQILQSNKLEIECVTCKCKIHNQQIHYIKPILLSQLLDKQIDYLSKTYASARCQNPICQFFIMGGDQQINYCPLCD